MVVISCKLDCCLQTTTGFLFQVWDVFSTSIHNIIPSLPHIHTKHQHILKYELLCVLWVTGTPATWCPDSFSRITPITVMDWFQPGSPLDKPNTADILKHRNESLHFLVLQDDYFWRGVSGCMPRVFQYSSFFSHFITVWCLKMNAK